MLDDHQYVKINLSNIVKNYLKLKSMLNTDSHINKQQPHTLCSAVVKANAYGLGIKEVVKVLYKCGCRHFWVTNLSEAIAIKNQAPHSQIYIFQGVNCEKELKIIIDENFIPVISELRQLDILNKNWQKSINIVLNFDTGIGRDGLQVEEIPKLNLNGCSISYIMSHLSCAEQKNHHLNIQQLIAVKALKRHFPYVKFTFANSSGIFLGNDYHFDLVRPGGALYGVNPLKNKKNPMLNVVEFRAAILNRKVFYKSQSIGYGATYKVSKGDKVLILNAGYYDGYKRMLSNRSIVYADGFFLPVIGVVSMNMIAVNANQLPDILFFQIKNVELIGEKINIEWIAKLMRTDQREILTNLSQNCKRIYIK